MIPRTLFPLAAFALVAQAAPAVAQPIQSFTMTKLQAAQKAGQPVLVDAFASWCPVCRAQQPTIEAMASDPRFKNLLILRLDYDNQTAEKKALGITGQSTLILFRGAKEIGRTRGENDAGKIRGFTARALG